MSEIMQDGANTEKITERSITMSKFMEEWGCELDEIMEKNGFVIIDYGTSLLSEKELSFYSVGYNYSTGSRIVTFPVADFDLEEDDVMEEEVQKKFQEKIKKPSFLFTLGNIIISASVTYISSGDMM